MAKTNESDNPEGIGMTHEEYHKLRVQAQKELREEIKFLKTEEEFQRLTADIEEHKARRLRAIAVQYQLKQGPQETAPSPDEEYNHPVAHDKPFGDTPKEPAKKAPAKKAPAKKSRTLKKA